ncbi:hypothetical protein M434DRAFT_26619 [Hypoxylon sp. CO27-5]|nr:hypothetical protein M434DRAFT_26619 [Hypoxylon sp. CO27-5]
MARSKRTPLPSRQRRSLLPLSSLPAMEELVEPKPAKRKRGKSKAITSCERCRYAHIKCVSRGSGEPCENCAKRSIRTCSFTQSPNKAGVTSTINTKPNDSHSLQIQQLQIIAISVLAYIDGQPSQTSSS